MHYFMSNVSRTSERTTELSRRNFLKTSSLVAAGAATMNFPSVLAQAKIPIRAVVIGAGGRGTGAGGDFLEAAKAAGVDGKIVGVADAFQNRIDGCLNEWKKKGAEIAPGNAVAGLDSYVKVLQIPDVNYAIIAGPPGFRAPHFKACVEAGKHVFMEKPVAVDGPTCRIMYAAAESSEKKNLKVAAGTQRRHESNYIETIKRLHDGMIGDIVTLRVYWVNGGPIWHRGLRGDTDLERQVNNWYHYIWLCGDHICEQHVHNLDVANWVMKDHPVRCWGMGARQQLGDKPGEIWDNFAIEYEYANGVRMFSYCGQITRKWSSVSEAVHGAKGWSNPGGSIMVKGGENYRYRGQHRSGYVQEHVDLINAIQTDGKLNEAKQVTDSTLTAIMGREAAYSGSDNVEWEAVLNSKFQYGPEALYTDASKLAWGSFRTLRPPMPSQHDVLKNPPIVAGA